MNRNTSNLPVKVIPDIFKVGEKRHWAEEAWQLIPCHRGKAAVFKGTANSTRKEKHHELSSKKIFGLLKKKM